MEFVATKALVLHVSRSSSGGGAPLVFLNSLGSDLRIWDGVVERLEKSDANHAMLRYDKRGHGLSDCPAGPYSIADHADDLLALLDALAIPRAVLVGISVGGLIALQIASREPERVGALVLCDTAAKIGTKESWNERITLIRQQGMAEAATGIAKRWFASGYPAQRPAEYRGYLNMLSRTPAEGYIGTCHALRDADLREQMAQILAPSLVLCGSEDISTPPELVRGLAQSLPDARFELLEAAGHLPCVEQPERLAQLIGGFVQEEADG